MISRSAEYALQAVIDLAMHGECTRTAQEIAGATGCSSSYVPKILHQLVHHGLVVSKRGARGGYTLCRGANQMTVYDVIAAVEPRRRMLSHWERPDTPHEFKRAGLLLDQAVDIVEQLLQARTIADLTNTEDTPTPKQSRQKRRHRK